jgi:polyhydroxyalkanoate synthesis regulator phasin
MSVFEEPNRDARIVGSTEGSMGPRLGFLGKFEAAYDAQVRANSLYGLEQYFRDAEQEQIRKIKKAGLEPPRSLNNSEDGSMFAGGDFTNSSRYIDAARFLAKGEKPEISSEIEARDEAIRKLRIKNPSLELKTYGEIFADVQKSAQTAERRDAEQETTWGGTLGGIAGIALGSVNPRTDPLNALTLGVGGAGRTAFRRIGSQVLSQGAIESVNQLTGVQTGRDLLGLESGFGEALGSIAGAAIGAGALQGVGEGIGFAARRWFRNTPLDPAPPVPVAAPPEVPRIARNADPSARVTTEELLSSSETFMLEVNRNNPLGGSRRAETVIQQELMNADYQLNRGVNPWELKPQTDTRLPGVVRSPEVNALESRMSVGELARSIDPETHRIADSIQTKLEQIRTILKDADAIPEKAKTNAALAELNATIDTLEKQVVVMSGKKKQITQQKLDDALVQREAAFPNSAKAVNEPTNTPEMYVAMRAKLTELEIKLRDLALPLSRARNAAEEKFTSGVRSDIADEIRDIVGKENPILNEPSWLKSVKNVENEPVVPVASLNDKIPQLNRAKEVGVDAADTLKSIMKEQEAATSVEVATTLRDINKLIAPETTEIKLSNGKVLELDDTVIEVPNLNGEGSRTITARQMLKEIADDNEVIKGISACSLRKTS